MDGARYVYNFVARWEDAVVETSNRFGNLSSLTSPLFEARPTVLKDQLLYPLGSHVTAGISNSCDHLVAQDELHACKAGTSYTRP
jgi:hypothetical protein